MTHARAPRPRNLEPRPVSIRTPSVLVMSHAHPKLSQGGAEMSAQALFLALRERGGKCWFLGCGRANEGQRLGAAITQNFGPGDYLYTPAVPFDYFKFANPDPHFPRAISELIAELRPDIVHAHHYARFGVEVFSLIKRVSPGTRIVLSLHEFLAICNNHGQMVKTDSAQLCRQESTAACTRCFSQFQPADFFLRKRYIQMFLADVDLFVAPSEFLAKRYIAWGIPEDRITVLENMPPAGVQGAMAPEPMLEQLPARSTQFSPVVAAETGSGARKTARPAVTLAKTSRSRGLRFGFFGQMSPLKGIGVLIDAARRLDKQEVENFSIVIYGDYRNQPEDFQVFVKAALADLPACVSFMGPYQNEDVGRLMRQVDAVIVPSRWWENSPVVIQEAFASGRPVICSNIGGMAEKVRHGIDGLHFEAGRPESLARVIRNLTEHPEVLAELSATLSRPQDSATALQAHLNAYARVR